jgi:hypothetical protein
MGETHSTHIKDETRIHTLVGNLERRNNLEDLCTWEQNIKIHLKYIHCEVEEWI